MFEQVRYRGPSLGELHDQYTKQRRIDQAAPIRSAHEVRIEAPTARVWDLLSDPTGWSAIDPAIHDVRLDAEVDVDVRFVWRNGNTRLHSRFAVVDPQREMLDRQRDGVSRGASAHTHPRGRLGHAAAQRGIHGRRPGRAVLRQHEAARPTRALAQRGQGRGGTATGDLPGGPGQWHRR